MRAGPLSATWVGELAAAAALALPLVLSEVAVIAIATTDVVMLGWLGPQALAAGALSTSLFLPLFLFALGFAVAVSPMVTHALGTGDTAGPRRTLRQAFWLTLCCSLPMSLVLWNGAELMTTLGQPPAITALAGDYLSIFTFVLIPQVWFVVLRCFMGAFSRPWPALVIILVAAALNVVANYGLIFGNFGLPALGIRGAAFASLSSVLFAFTALSLFIWRDPALKAYQIFINPWRPDWQRFRELGRLGLPISFSLLAKNGALSVAAFLMGSLGTVSLAAHTIVMQTAAISFMIAVGFSNATMVRVGLATGRGDASRARLAAGIGIALALFVTLIAAFILGLFGETLASFYLDEQNPGAADVLTLAVGLFSLAALYQVPDGLQVIALGALRGLKDTRVPMQISIAGHWLIGLSLAFILSLGFGLGASGVWVGLLSGAAALAGLLLLRLRYLMGNRDAATEEKNTREGPEALAH